MDNTITVEMRVDGAFTNIALGERKVLAGLQIVRGSQDVQDEIPPGQVTFRILDSAAYLDTQNPASPLYRKIGEGTHVRVKVNGAVQIGSATELKSVQASWDDTEDYVFAAVVASDVTDRLTAQAQALDSALTRYYQTLFFTTNEFGRLMAPLHWWKFEEGKQATRAEDSAGNVPLVGLATFGDTSAPPGGIRSLQTKYEARPAPLTDQSTNLSNQAPTGNVKYLGQDWVVEVCAKVSGAVVTDDTAPINIVEWRTHGLSGYWRIQVDDVTKCFQVDFFNTVVSAFTLTGTTPVRDGEWHQVRVWTEHIGPDIRVHLYVDGHQDNSMNVTGAVTSVPKLIHIYNFEDVDSTLRPALAHLLLWGPDYPAYPFSVDAFTGYADESEIVRILRLGFEEGIAGISDGYDENSILLGPQGANTYLDIVRAAASTNFGLILADPVQHNTINHIQRFGLYSQPAAVKLTYGHLAPGFRPAADDQRRANIITATADRAGSGAGDSGTFRYTIPDDDWFHWSTQDPPDGTYPRPATASYNPSDPTELHELAAWKAHLSSWREKRFAQIQLDLHGPRWTTQQIAAVRALDVGDVIEFDMTNAPAWVPYNSIRVMVRGFTRTLDRHIDSYVIATTPADAWEVEYVDADSTLAAPLTSGGTSALFASAADSPPWNTVLTSYNVQIDGDPVTVTNMAYGTPGFIAAGTPAHADNTTIAPALPAGITVDVGQSLYLFCAVRNTAASVTATPPAGWTLVDVGQTHIALYHRYYTTGVVAPTVTPTGGAAGDTVSGVVFAFTNCSPTIDSTDGMGGSYVSTNSSAQNIAYGPLLLRTARTKGLRERNCLQLLLAWKQDDYTSVASPAGFTELAEASTTTGNDQSLYVAAAVVTDPTAVAAGSIVVTGGASAVSKAIIVALRPTQTATITRNIAGVAVAHTTGDPVHVWRPGLMGL